MKTPISLLFAITVAAAWSSATPFAQGAGAAAAEDKRSASTPVTVERSAIFDITKIATSTIDTLLEREVVAVPVRVEETRDHGFWVTPVAGEERVFVVPAEGSLIAVRAGELVSVHGEVRLMPNAGHEQRTGNPTSGLVMPYVYAYTVRTAWPIEKQHGATNN
jgi:hypothetical protein